MILQQDKPNFRKIHIILETEEETKLIYNTIVSGAQNKYKYFTEKERYIYEEIRDYLYESFG